MHLRCYHTRIEDLKDVWDIKRVQDIHLDIRNDHDELTRLWDAVVKRDREIRNLTFTWHVEFNRHERSCPKKHIEYQIEIYRTPDIKQEGKLPRVYLPFMHGQVEEFISKTFTGKEKKAAREYAIKCANHYKVYLEGNVVMVGG